jgi:hypothetical protein
MSEMGNSSSRVGHWPSNGRFCRTLVAHALPMLSATCGIACNILSEKGTKCSAKVSPSFTPAPSGMKVRVARRFKRLKD